MRSCHYLHLRYKISCALLSFCCHILISLLKQLLMSEQFNASQAFGMIESHKICYLKKMILFLLRRRSGVIQRSSGGADEPARLSCLCQRLCLRWSYHPQVTVCVLHYTPSLPVNITSLHLCPFRYFSHFTLLLYGCRGKSAETDGGA